MARAKTSVTTLSERGHEARPLRGFTLIELLVVVAIIALLVAILVPALNRAREEAKKVVCLSNLHQIGVAVHCYTNDNGGRMPGYRDDLSDAPVGYLYASLIYKAYLHDQFFLGGNTANDNGNPRKLNIYVSNAETVFRCPSDKGFLNVSPNDKWYPREPVYDNLWNGWLLQGNSYLYNATPGVPRDAPRILAHRQMASLKQPARQVLMGDATLFYTWLEPGTPYGAGMLAPVAGYNWHDPPAYHRSAQPDPASLGYGYTVLVYDPLANLLFLDGHAATVQLQQKFVTSDYLIYDGN